MKEQKEEGKLFIFNQMNKTRDMFGLCMCTCVCIKWLLKAGVHVDTLISFIICYRKNMMRKHICIIASINVLVSDWPLMIIFHKDINRVDLVAAHLDTVLSQLLHV